MGVWIETRTRARIDSAWCSHTLYGCVDWNSIPHLLGKSLISHTLYGCVDWNSQDMQVVVGNAGHTLYGCVDWNLKKMKKSSSPRVTPCMGVWIETCWLVSTCVTCSSHPVWVCGLKLILTKSIVSESRVTPCMGVWIETPWIESREELEQVTPCMGVWIETTIEILII